MQAGARRLGPVACDDLRTQVLGLDETMWLADRQRQTEFRNVHSQTQSIILIFCEGWPEVKIEYRSPWSLLGPAAGAVMREIIATHYPVGGTILRAMLARLPPGCAIDRHRDTHPSFDVSHRIHLPLATNAGVRFIVGSNAFPLEVGQAFELDNGAPHAVRNEGDTNRIHFIFDYAPPPSQNA